jgi:hypothetical protein
MLTAARTEDGSISCKSWYPEGHAFSQDEREAAVLEYAKRLGVPAPAPAKKSRGAVRQSASACGTTQLGSIGAPNPVLAQTGRAPGLSQSAPTALPQEKAGDEQTAFVATAPVRTIDASYDLSAHDAQVEGAGFAADAIYSPGQSLRPAQLGPGLSGESECLQVASNGEYWGFQNHCAKPLQFAYCEMNDTNPLTSCRETSVSGSVAANGFSALVGDRSLAEKDVEHDFRWMACDGGAGEVVVHLDHFDPPAGRCLRMKSAAN